MTHAYVLLLLVVYYYYYTHALVISTDKAKILNFWTKTLVLTTEWKWKLNNPVNKTSSDQSDLLIYEGDYSILYLRVFLCAFGFNLILRSRFTFFNFFYVNKSHMGSLFITVYILKYIKNRSHDIIYTFKNYFTIILSIFSFSNNKFNPNRLILNRNLFIFLKQWEGRDRSFKR